ncbi:mechanosensitive ion channel family protein [Thermoproteota archaeon]
MAIQQLVTFLDSSIGKALLVGFILLSTIAVERIVRKLIHNVFERKSYHIRVDPTQFVFLKHFVSMLIYLVGLGIAIYTIPSLRSLSVSLFAGAGVLAVVIGFAAQKAFSNIISGIFIALFKPFRVGDIIEFSNKVGIVEDINLRHTVIRNFENNRYVVPNSVISDEVITNSDIGEEKTCKFVEFGISYDSDIDLAMKIMQEEATHHHLCIDTRKQDEKHKRPKVMVKVMGMGDSSVNLRAWAWAKDPIEAYHLGWDLNKKIKERFDKEGIEIPFPYRTVVYKKDLKK